jgi:hypothetical protein
VSLRDRAALILLTAGAIIISLALAFRYDWTLGLLAIGAFTLTGGVSLTVGRPDIIIVPDDEASPAEAPVEGEATLEAVTHLDDHRLPEVVGNPYPSGAPLQ